MMSIHVHVTLILSGIRIQWHVLAIICKHMQNRHLQSQFHRTLFTKLSLDCIILIGASGCMEYEMESKYLITEPIAFIPSKWNQAIVNVNKYITIRNGDSFSVYKMWITPHSTCNYISSTSTLTNLIFWWHQFCWGQATHWHNMQRCKITLNI